MTIGTPDEAIAAAVEDNRTTDLWLSVMYMMADAQVHKAQAWKLVIDEAEASVARVEHALEQLKKM